MTTEQLLHIINSIASGSAIAWLVTSFQPFQNLVDKLLKKNRTILGQLAYKYLTCAKCCGLMVGLICTGSIAYAAIVSILAELIWRKTQ